MIEHADKRLSIGGNLPPICELIAEEENLPEKVSAYLEEHYAKTAKLADDLLAEARKLPQKIDNDETMGTFAKLIKRMRDATREIEAFHAKEKAPYFRSGQTADNFFFPLWEKLVRRTKAARPGAADVLQQRLDEYLQRKLALEQERRRQAEERARREAEEKRLAELAAIQKAEADRLAADRAKKPESIERKEAIAEAAEQHAAQAATEAKLANESAQEARVATLARPAEMVRTRVEDGPTVTMGTETYAIVEDYDLLDMAKLRPFIAHDAWDKALRAWAATTNFNEQMDGARIGRKPRTKVI